MGEGDMNPRSLRWKHQEVLVELQDSWLITKDDITKSNCAIHVWDWLDKQYNYYFQWS